MCRKILLLCTTFVSLLCVTQLSPAAKSPETSPEIEQLNTWLKELSLHDLRKHLYDNTPQGIVFEWVKDRAFGDGEGPLLYLCVKEFFDRLRRHVSFEPKECESAFFAAVLSLGRAAQDCAALVLLQRKKLKDLIDDEPVTTGVSANRTYSMTLEKLGVEVSFEPYRNLASKYVREFFESADRMSDDKFPQIEPIIAKVCQWFVIGNQSVKSRTKYPSLVWVSMLTYIWKSTIDYNYLNPKVVELCMAQEYQDLIANVRDFAIRKYFDEIQKIITASSDLTNTQKWLALFNADIDEIFKGLHPQGR